MDKKLSDPFTDAELDVINRYRLERRARQYDGKIERIHQKELWYLYRRVFPMAFSEFQKRGMKSL